MAENPVEQRVGPGVIGTVRAIVRVREYQGEVVSREQTVELDRMLGGQLGERLSSFFRDEGQELFGAPVELSMRIGYTASVEILALAEAPVAFLVDPAKLKSQFERLRARISAVIDEVSEAGLFDVDKDFAVEGPFTNPVSGEASSPWERTSTVLATIGTGIGVLGFVTLVGGAIEYARLTNAGLPAEEAVGVIPSANLVAVGAHVLVPALFVAFLIAFAIHYVNLVAQIGRRRHGDQRLPRPTIADLREASRLQSPAGDSTPERDTPMRRAALLAFVFFVAAMIALLASTGVTKVWGSVGLAAGFSFVIFFTALRVRTTLWVSATAFVAASLYLVALDYIQELGTQRLRPAAVVRGNDHTTGFFVAETSSQVYLGRFRAQLDLPSGRIIVMPKDEVSDISIGPLLPRKVARDRSFEMARELCLISRSQSVQQLGAKPRKKRSECDRLLISGKTERSP